MTDPTPAGLVAVSVDDLRVVYEWRGHGKSTPEVVAALERIDEAMFRAAVARKGG